LRASLAAAGLFTGEVEAAGALALLWPSPGTAAPDRAARLAVTRLAREHGFTHVALEIPAPPTGQPREQATDAALPRD
jgi:hypothetical protein